VSVNEISRDVDYKGEQNSELAYIQVNSKKIELRDSGENYDLLEDLSFHEKKSTDPRESSKTKDGADRTGHNDENLDKNLFTSKDHLQVPREKKIENSQQSVRGRSRTENKLESSEVDD
jgi:hypothetical protein